MNTALQVLAALALSVSPFSELGLSDDDVARLQKREVVVKDDVYKTASGSNAGRGKGWVVVDRSADECWKVLMQSESHSEFMPRLAKVTVHERTPTRIRLTNEISLPLSTVRYTLLQTVDAAARTVTFTLDPKAENDIRETSGEWRVIELGPKRSLLQYLMTLDSGMGFVPRFLEDYLTRRDLPAIMDNLRKRIESGGTWKKS